MYPIIKPKLLYIHTLILLFSKALARLRTTRVKLYVKKLGVTDDVITRDKTEYSSHALAEVVNGINMNEQVLGTRYRTGK